ncbi:putative receptor-type tyrosine-protein phosphatase mosPTP-1 [Amphiura filiformis]|uniref:putative receptor-type tyrosine-protein phosphatase mosPTP-1 n=1 Tax=Amphiura filiformis TaxID=82378 RepID=UPI003B22280E
MVIDQCQVVELGSPEVWDTAFIDWHSRTATLTGLVPYSTYTVSVRAKNSAGTGRPTLLVATTNTETPQSFPSNVTAYDVSSNEIRLRWSQPPCGSRHGKIVKYSYVLQNVAGVIAKDGFTEAGNVTLRNLSPFTNYTFRVAAMTAVGRGPDAISSIRTSESEPSAPSMFQVKRRSKNTIHVTWNVPEYPNGVIIKYSVQAIIAEKPYDSSFTPSLKPVIQNEVASKERTYTFTNLKPSTKYELSVAAHTKENTGRIANIQQFTYPVTVQDISRPPSLGAITGSKVTPTTVEIIIQLSNSEFVSGYQVGVELETNVKDPVAISFQQKIHSPTCITYVAASLTKAYVEMNSRFVIGDDETYGEYSNPPLHDGYTYIVYIAYYSRINDTSHVVSWSEGTEVTLPSLSAKSYPKPTPAGSAANIIMAGVFVCVVVLMAIVIVVLVFRLRSRSNNKETNDSKKGNRASAIAMTGVASGGQIQMSTDGYVKYEPEKRATTYQDLKFHPDDEEATYQDISSELSPTDETHGHADSVNAAYDDESAIRCNERDANLEYEEYEEVISK